MQSPPDTPVTAPETAPPPPKPPLISNHVLAGGLAGLVLVVLGIGIWNERHRPQASFHITSNDLIQDTLSPAADSSVPPTAEATAADGPEPTTATSAAPTPPARVRIATADVNVRSQPSRKGAIVARPAAGSEFALSGHRQQADGIDWVGIKLGDGKEAWVGAQFVKPATAQTSAQVQAPEDDVEAAARVVSQLLMAPARAWPEAPDALRQLTTYALLKQIFKQRPDAITPQHAPALDACMKTSAPTEKVKNLKVYELATACALALGWR